MDEIIRKLNHMLDGVEAPVTSLKVACIIETQNSEHCGTNHEWSDPLFFAHAEERALFLMKQRGDFSGIKTIYFGGRGHVKLSQISPCDNCFNILAPMLSEDSKIVLFEPNNFFRHMSFSSSELIDAYSKKSYSAIVGNRLSEIEDELKKKTPLVQPDLSFVANLRLLGLENQISFYLVGSASGRNGISQLIHQKENSLYSDIDIVATSELHEDFVLKLFESLAGNYYPKLDRQVRRFKMYGTGQPMAINKYLDDTGKVKLELTVGRNKNTTFTRKDNLYKNFFHQLS